MIRFAVSLNFSLLVVVTVAVAITVVRTIGSFIIALAMTMMPLPNVKFHITSSIVSAY